MNYMPAIGAHNKDRTATKRVFCRNTKTTHPKRGIPPGKTCILTKTYFSPAYSGRRLWPLFILI